MESEDHLWYLALSFQPRGPSAWVWVPSWRCLNLVSDAPPSGYRIPQLCLSVFYAFCTGICTVSHLLLLSLASRGVTLSSSALCKTCHVDHVTLNSKWSCFSASSAKRYMCHHMWLLLWFEKVFCTWLWTWYTGRIHFSSRAFLPPSDGRDYRYVLLSQVYLVLGTQPRVSGIPVKPWATVSGPYFLFIHFFYQGRNLVVDWLNAD